MIDQGGSKNVLDQQGVGIGGRGLVDQLDWHGYLLWFKEKNKWQRPTEK
jgi:hypothetical protein